MNIISIKKSREFKIILSKGKKYHSKSLIIIRNKTPDEYNFNQSYGYNSKEFVRIGIIASKAVGNSVIRNRCKRVIRQIFTNQDISKYLEICNDYVVIAKKQIINIKFHEINRDIIFCLKSLKSR